MSVQAPSPAPVDVIVPVYRGLEDARRCLESVLASACQTPWRLIVINDASPEPELTGWLRDFALRDARVTLLENAQNLGFVATVNRGMALSGENDALLLNSDAEVAGDWLDRLRAAAYSGEKVATVTPFSNNATICSYPRFCQDNELPEGWNTARLDALFARVNAGQTADVPTGVGFCLYIRRAALRELGLFDVENFGKGYGEENDFCRRAARAGWRNLHALDVFVRHVGGVSFGADKAPGERAAMHALRRLHPSYESEVTRFIQADPARLARHVADAARLAEEGQPVILAVLHNRLGGTEQHVLELARLLRGKAQFLVLRPAPGRHVSLRLAGESEAFDLHFALDPARRDRPGESGAGEGEGEDDAPCADDYEALLATLRALGVCHVHYHHRVGHMRAILDLARRLGVSHDFTVHDYYPICPQINLVNPSQGYCGEEGAAQCAQCLAKSPAPHHAGITEWRRENIEFLGRARFVIAPSRDVLARMLRHHLPAAPLRLVPHADIDPQAPPPAPQPPKLDGQRPLKVALLGALSVAKGAHVVADVTELAKTTGAPVEFHLIGHSYIWLKTRPQAHLTIHGRYAEADLPALLRRLQPDVVWFPAQWPETYSYTLSACLQGGWPVVAPDLGAFAERLAGRAWTWVRPWKQSAAQWLAFFVELRQCHALTGQPPAPAPALEDWPHLSSALAFAPHPPQWYAGPYLQGLPALRAQPLAASQLAPYLPAPAGLSAEARSRALTLLARLRALPMLRGLARSIPPHWQRRVKDWLVK
jgi:GT2 family glycosyltransferase